MSNYLAIASVTAALKALLDAPVSGTVNGANVFIGRPKADVSSTDAEIYIYLYQIMTNGAYRNTDVPTRRNDGTLIQHPTAALDLYYLLSFYGKENELEPQRLLGTVVRVLHSKPILTRKMIRTTTEGISYLEGSDLHAQVEMVKFSPLSLNLEELSKLWSVFFQTPYSLSVAYQASLVLIESTFTKSTPLPVLTRGPEDHGAKVFPNLIPPIPLIDRIEPPNKQPSALLGDTLTISGHHLKGENISIIFRHRLLEDPNELIVLSNDTPTELQITLPDCENGAEDWPAGICSVAVNIPTEDGTVQLTNEIPLLIAPQITTNLPITVQRDTNGDITFTLEICPDIMPEQRASLIVGDLEVLAEPHTEQTNQLTFKIQDAPVGEHYVRLRIDGTESHLVDRSVEPPVFDETQKVIIE